MKRKRKEKVLDRILEVPKEISSNEPKLTVVRVQRNINRKL